MKLDRREEIEKTLKKTDVELLRPLIDQILFLESKLEELKKGDEDESRPFLLVSASNPARQKTTAAFKQYHDCIQQYQNCMKIIKKAAGDDGTEEESPLRAWVKSRNVD